MIKTAIAHAAVAAIIQLILGQFIGYGAAGVVAVAFYVSREITQHEYKLGIRRGWVWGEKLPIQPWEPLVRGWSLDSVLDVASPAAACAVIAATPIPVLIR
ncbi:hypothetical protein [Halomonas elongata]|uniref:hypothetical protein n=1 Tax=Halomonas elongata TaxID=2746 RepID=UPI0023AEB093|nr:hypothetical protein [Halomonas elongata]